MITWKRIYEYGGYIQTANKKKDKVLHKTQKITQLCLVHHIPEAEKTNRRRSTEGERCHLLMKEGLKQTRINVLRNRLPFDMAKGQNVKTLSFDQRYQGLKVIDLKKNSWYERTPDFRE